MLQDPNVSRIIKDYIEPIQIQVSALQVEVESLKHKFNTDDEKSINATSGKGIDPEKVGEMKSVLEELVMLKNRKEEKGKDKFYKDRQPVAWHRAKQLLNQLDQ